MTPVPHHRAKPTNGAGAARLAAGEGMSSREERGRYLSRTEYCLTCGRFGMTPTPTALGMFLCEQIIVDKKTDNLSPINIFNLLRVDGFPSFPQRFSVFAALTDGQGHGKVELVGARLDSGERVFGQPHDISFPNRKTVVSIDLRVTNITFPEPGAYELQLLIDGEMVARRELAVFPLDASS